MKLFDILIRLLGACAVLALFMGYLGVLHPFFDSVAVMRLHVLISLGMAVAYMLLRRRWRSVVIFGVIALIGGATMLPYAKNWSEAGSIEMMQANLLFRNDAAGQVSFIKDTLPDIITLQEVTNRSLPNLQTLIEYPTQKFCGFATVGGVMIMSRFPEIPDVSGCIEGNGLAWVGVMTPEGPATIVSVHLHWPWPFGQAGQIDRLLPILNDLPRPVIIGGDFNMVAWSNNIHRLEDASDTQALRGIRLSLDIYKGWGRFPIDHILVPNGDGVAAKGPTLGSDHNSILADISLRQ